MRGSRLAFVALCLLLAVGFAGLGVWQVERRTWKLDKIAKVDARVHAAPAGLPPRAQWPGDQEYRHVRLTGVFHNQSETLVQAVTELGPGWWVLTPLDTGATTVLINRGFVPQEMRDPRTRQRGQPNGPVTVTGLLRKTEPGGGFLRSNDSAANRWYSRDVAAIAGARHLSNVAPFFLDADATPNPGGYPVGGLTVIEFPNNHLVYAFTWYALALLSITGAVILLRSERRR